MGQRTPVFHAVSAWRRAWVVLALAVLLAQGLGLWHRSWHGEGPSNVASGWAAPESSAFGHAAGDAACQLLDHLWLGASLPLADVSLTLPDRVASAPPEVHRTAWCETLGLAYHARAPPHRG